MRTFLRNSTLAAGLAAFAILGGAGAALVHAQEDKQAEVSGPTKFRVDAVHSSIVFKIKHMGVAWFWGRFNKVSGDIVWDEADASKSSINVTVTADSIDTNNKDRDAHVKTADYINAEKYPEATFASTSIKKTGENTFEATGNMTFMGVTKPLTFTFTQTGFGPDAWGGFRTGAEAEFVIKRGEFGMPVDEKGALSNEVHVHVGIEAVKG